MSLTVEPGFGLTVAILEEHQQIGKVSGGTEHRAAMLALAEIASLEQIVPVGEGRKRGVVVFQNRRQAFRLKRFEIGDNCQRGGVGVGGSIPGETRASSVKPAVPA